MVMRVCSFSPCVLDEADKGKGIAAQNYGRRSIPLVATAITVAVVFLGWL